MRGDCEILAYNLLQWSAGKLPWEEKKILDVPVKVQEAKESFMSNIDKQLIECYATKQCPGTFQKIF